MRETFLEQEDSGLSNSLHQMLNKNLNLLIDKWQIRLHELKNNIAKNISPNQHKKDLKTVMRQFLDSLKENSLNEFNNKIAVMARLRVSQGFNLHDMLEEVVVCEDVIFQTITDELKSQPELLLQTIDFTNKIMQGITLAVSRTYIQNIEKSIKKREHLIYVDEKTKIHNYRYFMEQLKIEIMRAKRFNHPLSLCIIDIDFFKLYNDVNGHIAGDTALIQLAQLIKKNSRKIDIAARYGGEEFAIILPETGKGGAEIFSERLRKEVAKHIFGTKESETERKLTISIGISGYPQDSQEPEELIRKADQALYYAKLTGRNKVHVS